MKIITDIEFKMLNDNYNSKTSSVDFNSQYEADFFLSFNYFDPKLNSMIDQTHRCLSTFFSTLSDSRSFKVCINDLCHAQYVCTSALQQICLIYILLWPLSIPPDMEVTALRL